VLPGGYCVIDVFLERRAGEQCNQGDGSSGGANVVKQIQANATIHTNQSNKYTPFKTIHTHTHTPFD
jgi:hypothetical protein